MVSTRRMVAAVVLGAATLTACSSVSQDEVEGTVTQELENAGLSVNSVECPGDLEAEVGTTMTCEVDLESGDFTRVDLEVSEVVDNEVRYQIVPVQ